MSELIAPFDSQKGRPQIYPWSTWADGNARRLFKDKDFNAELISMRTMIHRKARDLGLNARTQINEADQSIQVIFQTKD
jgi:hypothetical protein